MTVSAKSAPVTVDGWYRGDWMQTFTGKRFYPLDAQPGDIDPRDVAHALSLLCRYNGHIDRFYSVAEHCVLMSTVMPSDALALEALLHDGSEAYCGDMVRPLKHTKEMTPYRVAEDRVMDALAVRFGLPVDAAGIHHKSAEVQDADTRILLTERTALMSNHRPSNRWPVDGMEALAVTIKAWSPAEAERAYLDRLAELGVLVEPIPEPNDSGPWRDRQGDVWTLGEDGLLHTPETCAFSREHVEKKWGPLVQESNDSGLEDAR